MELTDEPGSPQPEETSGAPYPLQQQTTVGPMTLAGQVSPGGTKATESSTGPLRRPVCPKPLQTNQPPGDAAPTNIPETTTSSQENPDIIEEDDGNGKESMNFK